VLAEVVLSLAGPHLLDMLARVELQVRGILTSL
jgi:hypothetical protein